MTIKNLLNEYAPSNQADEFIRNFLIEARNTFNLETIEEFNNLFETTLDDVQSFLTEQETKDAAQKVSGASTPSTIPAVPTQPITSDHTGRIVRHLSGASVYDINTKELVGSITEIYIRDTRLHHNAIVEYEIGYNNKVFINKVLSNPDEDTNTITVFPYGIVEKNQYDELIIKRNASNEKFEEYHPTNTFFKIPEIVFESRNNIREGSIIDLAWENSTPHNVRIRWAQNGENLPEKKFTVKTRTDTKKPKEPISTLDFNLDNKTVGIIVGDNIRSTVYNQLMEEHNGNCVNIDAFTNNSQIKNKLADVDIVILVQNFNKHKTSSIVSSYASDHNLPFAIATSAGTANVERAIYRAVNNLPAFEASASTDYPTI